MEQKTVDLLKLGALVVAGYFAWRFVSGAREKVETVGSAIGDAVAKLIVGKSTIAVKSGVVFPGGERVAMQKLLDSGVYLDQQGTFSLKNGARYQLVTPRRPDGWFDARRV